jgi:Flp pilus assembly pilin Flp
MNALNVNMQIARTMPRLAIRRRAELRSAPTHSPEGGDYVVDFNFDLIRVCVAMLRNREEGQALVEYALILSLVSVVAILLLTNIGNGVKSVLQSVVSAL